MAAGDVKGFRQETGNEFTEVVLNASYTEINTGTETSKFVSPVAIAASLYRKVYIQSGTPSTPVAGDLWIDTT